jgi:hypothetical protein
MYKLSSIHQENIGQPGYIQIGHRLVFDPQLEKVQTNHLAVRKAGPDETLRFLNQVPQYMKDQMLPQI